jgi:hypothetical protein
MGNVCAFCAHSDHISACITRRGAVRLKKNVKVDDRIAFF